jgi:hypothetical protein
VQAQEWVTAKGLATEMNRATASVWGRRASLRFHTRER